MADTIRTEIRRHLQQGADDLNNQPICDGDNFIAFQVPDGAGCGIVRHNVIIKSVTGKESNIHNRTGLQSCHITVDVISHRHPGIGAGFFTEVVFRGTILISCSFLNALTQDIFKFRDVGSTAISIRLFYILELFKTLVQEIIRPVFYGFANAGKRNRENGCTVIPKQKFMAAYLKNLCAETDQLSGRKMERFCCDS